MNIVFTVNEIKTAAQKFWSLYSANKIFAFHGEMGAGKTTFIHALCEVLGIKNSVTSPTFAIINEYKSNEEIIFHMDWYRLKNEEEAQQAGVEDCLLSGNICFVEWPENAAKLLPVNTLHLYINTVDEKTRSLNLSSKA